MVQLITPLVRLAYGPVEGGITSAVNVPFIEVAVNVVRLIVADDPAIVLSAVYFIKDPFSKLKTE